MPMALLLFLCLACNNRAKEPGVSKDSTTTAVSDVAVEHEEEDKESPQTPGSPGQKKVPLPPPPNPDWDKKIIKTANLTLEINNFKAYTDRLRQTVKQSGGYIGQEQQTQSASVIENTVTIKVPVNKFDDLLQQLPADSDKVVEKRISSEDVTREFVDTRLRLETKKEARERYLELLRRAGSMKDVLAVQEVIDGLQEEMDAAAGQVAYMSHSAAFSTINLRFYQVLDRSDISPSFGRRLIDALVSGWGWLGEAVLQLMGIWPILLLAGLTLFWVSRRRKVKTKQAL